MLTDLAVQLRFALGGPLACRQALTGGTRARVVECGLCGSQTTFEIVAAGGYVGESRAEIRLGFREAVDICGGRGVPPLGIVSCADRLREQVLDAGAPIDFLCDACLQLALPFGRLFGGKPFVFNPRVRRIDCRLSISEPAFESAMRCGGLRKLRRKLQYLARKTIDVGGCRGAILTRTSDLESRRTQLFVDHVPGGRGPGHGDLVLGLAFSQLRRGGHHGRLMALLRHPGAQPWHARASARDRRMSRVPDRPGGVLAPGRLRV